MSHIDFARIATAIGTSATALSLLAFSSFVPPVANPAYALPVNQSCRITTYYKTAAKAKEVGVRTTCHGVKKWGVTSRYFDVETLDTGNPGHTTGGGGGNLPCEFLAAGCSNLPENRN